MFTIDAIKAAHGKVKSGADFPAYIRDIAQLGVLRYETHVSDGHTVYYGGGDVALASLPTHAELTVADQPDAGGFNEALKAHQDGQTDYPTFLRDCAKHGVDKWEVKLEVMTCTYLDKTGRQILEESIPQV